jgi:hypothetical protein
MKDTLMYKSTLQPQAGYIEPGMDPGVGLDFDDDRILEFRLKE